MDLVRAAREDFRAYGWHPDLNRNEKQSEQDLQCNTVSCINFATYKSVIASGWPVPPVTTTRRDTLLATDGIVPNSHKI